MTAVPYWRLSAFYLFYFASLGALVPYWSVYLQARGFDAAQIGTLFAILMATKIVAPNVWGWLADHSGRRMAIIRSASLLSLVTFLGVFWVGGYWGMALVMAAFSFFWNATLPQFEAVTLNHLGEDSHRYAHVRLWGSVGFIAAVFALGPLAAGPGIQALPWILAALFAFIWFSSLTVGEAPGRPHDGPRPALGAVLRRPEVIALLLVCFLNQFSHGPYYTFYSILLQDHGYSGWAVGALWSWGVVAEILVFLGVAGLFARHAPRTLMVAALALTALRWVLVGHAVEHPWVMALAQTLHAASFGLYHAVAIHLVHSYFPGPLQGRGQALYSSLSFGAGGAAGSLLAGWGWERLGPAVTFDLAAAAAFLGALVALRYLPAILDRPGGGG